MTPEDKKLMLDRAAMARRQQETIDLLDRQEQVKQEAQSLKAELWVKVAPLPSFSRGVLVGAGALQAVQLLTPDVLLVHEWPTWARAIVGTVFLGLAINYLIRQRGLMFAWRNTK